MSSIVEIDLSVALELKGRMVSPQELEFPAFSMATGGVDQLWSLALIFPHVGQCVAYSEQTLTVSDIDRVLRDSGRLAA